ncbi:MAG: HEPN domain-containing protein [Planctomycetes bacterium]|nr:HEPN domain-containing protein [Planctomycetota bacterium]
MKPHTAEWVAKAEGDGTTARREFDAQTNPNHDAVCFHAQQCAEKYLKARLVEAGETFPKTHDLSALLDLVLPFEPSWVTLREDLDRLTDLAVEVRYPGLTADRDDAAKALHMAEKLRHLARIALGLESEAP